MSSQLAGSRIEERPHPTQDSPAVDDAASTFGESELCEGVSQTATGKNQSGPSVVTTPADALAYFNRYHASNPRVQISGSLAAAILKDKSGVGARLWYILRLFTSSGSMPKSVAVWLLSNPQSPARVCGERQILKLLHRFNDRYWELTKGGWLRLMSEKKLAESLGLDSFTQHVLVPLEELTVGKGRFNALLHDVSLASRRGETIISRTRQQERTGLSPTLQRQYEKTSGTGVQSNYVIGPRVDNLRKEEEEQLLARCRRQRKVVWIHTDWLGVIGEPVGRYVAWQTANTYRSTHELASKGKTRRLNKALKAPRYQAGTGQDSARFGRAFFPDANRSAKAISRATNECFVPCVGRSQAVAGVGLWRQVK